MFLIFFRSQLGHSLMFQFRFEIGKLRIRSASCFAWIYKYKHFILFYEYKKCFSVNVYVLLSFTAQTVFDVFVSISNQFEAVLSKNIYDPCHPQPWPPVFCLYTIVDTRAEQRNKGHTAHTHPMPITQHKIIRSL